MSNSQEELIVLASLETLGSKEGFVSFVHSQPEDRRIDHSSWDSCAVGDYARDMGIAVDPDGCSRGMLEFPDKVLTEDVMEVLNSPMRHEEDEDYIGTYGDLSSFIKDNQ